MSLARTYRRRRARRAHQGIWARSLPLHPGVAMRRARRKQARRRATAGAL